MEVPLAWLLLLLSCTITPGQRYAERNVLPAPSSSSYDDEYDDYYEDEDLYGFQEEQPDVYKWNVEDYPHPVDTPRFCNRLKASHVCDPDTVIDREQADLLDDYIQKLHRETPCICDTCDGEGGGIVVGIALLKYMHHPYHMHHSKVIRSFAEALRVQWSLGSCDNDILIVVATMDRLSYTDVGKATSDYLSVQEAHRIFLENKAKFSAFNFSEGLMDILRGYHRATRDMAIRTTAGRGDLDMGMVTGVIIGSVLLIGLLLFLGFVVYRRCRSNRKEGQGDTDLEKQGPVTVSSSWSKKDIKLLSGPEKSPAPSSAKYQKCSTEEDEGGHGGAIEEQDEMDFSLASPDDTSFRDETRLTSVTSDAEALDKDLTTAAEGLAKTFPSGKLLVTDM